MDQQLRLGDSYLPRSDETDTSVENHLTQNGEEGIVSDYELHPEVNSEVSDTTTLEQRRAYKIEMQVETLFHVVMLYCPLFIPIPIYKSMFFSFFKFIHHFYGLCSITFFLRLLFVLYLSS